MKKNILILAAVLLLALCFSVSAGNGCKKVKVYGVKGTEAERVESTAKYKAVDPNADKSAPVHLREREKQPVELPLVPRKKAPVQK